MIEAAESNHLSFHYFLSDQDNIQNNGVGGTLSQSTDFTSSSETLLSGMHVDGTNYMVEGMTEIQINSTQCATTSRYMCVQYVFEMVLNLPFRDGVEINNWKCVTIGGMHQCNDGISGTERN